MYNKYTRKKNNTFMCKINPKRSSTKGSSTKGSSTKKFRRLRYKNKNNPENKNGGSVIASGSYGCVFVPPLQCSSKSTDASTKIVDGTYVSKLMSKKDAYREMIEVKNVKEIADKLSTIYGEEIKKYFLVNDAFVCTPEKMTKNDLVDFNDKCKLFSENDISYDNKDLPNILSELRLLQIKNGGNTLQTYIKEMYLTFNIKTFNAKFIEFNNLLIDLLQNAIIPLNDYNYNHFDLKTDNVLINTKTAPPLLTIIDWGLSSNSDGVSIPRPITHGQFAFNSPYSVILFDTISNDLHIKPDTKQTADDLVERVIENNPGHINYIKGSIINPNINVRWNNSGKKTRKVKLISTPALSKTTLGFLKKYIKVILDKYLQGETFNTVKFFNEVFSKNADIWGFLTIYNDILNKIISPIIRHLDIHGLPGSTKIFIKLEKDLSKIIYDYMIDSTYAAQSIPRVELIDRLTALNLLV